MSRTRGTLRIGIVGCGRNTRTRHIPGLTAQTDVEIVAVCNRTAASSERAAAEFGIPKVHRSWLDLVSDDSVDAVVIGTWPYLHGPVTVAALNAGKHVLCEARMAMNSNEASAMYQASLDHPGLVAQVVPSPLTFDVDETAQRLVAEGNIGEIVAVEVIARGGSFPNGSAPLTWRQDEGLSGHNIMSMGIWYEALARWIGHATSVVAVGKVHVPSRPDPTSKVPRFTRIPDHISIVCEMACGAQASFTISDVAGGRPEQSIVLYGSIGTLRFADGRLERIDAAGAVAVNPAAGEIRGWNVESDFVGSIRDGAPVRLTSFEEGLRYMRFTDAVWQSMSERRAVPITP